MCLQNLLTGFAILIIGISVTHADAQQFSVPHFIYQKKSLYRNILVAESDGYRCMKFGRLHASQACIEIDNPSRLVHNYTQGLMTSLYIATSARRTLVLGLGGGVIPRALRMIDKEMIIDTVELDPAVVDVAKSFFSYKEDTRSHIYVDDARVFVRKQHRMGIVYDIIIIDAFDKDYIPEHLLTKEFLEEVKSLLSANGTVASNTFADGALAKHEAATYQSVFGSIFNVDMDSGNRIILACRDHLPSLTSIREKAIQLDSQLQPLGVSSSDLLYLIKVQPSVTGIRILTDQYSPSNLLLLMR
jgi:spermidine synthase